MLIVAIIDEWIFTFACIKMTSNALLLFLSNFTDSFENTVTDCTFSHNVAQQQSVKYTLLYIFWNWMRFSSKIHKASGYIYNNLILDVWVLKDALFCALCCLKVFYIVIYLVKIIFVFCKVINIHAACIFIYLFESPLNTIALNSYSN